MTDAITVVNDRRSPDVRLVTGIAAITVGALTLAEFVVQLLFFDAQPALDDGPALTEWATRSAFQTLFTILLDTFLLAAVIVFISGFRQLITRVRPDLQWVTNILYGSGLLLLIVTLAGDGFEGGVALDTMGLEPDPSSIRALTVGHTLMFASIGCTLTALVAASAGYLIIASDALPAWTGYLAYAVAALNLLTLPTMFGGTDPNSFLAAGGGATVLLATFPWLVWVVCVGAVAIRERRQRARECAPPA